jgi:hypothetical protein
MTKVQTAVLPASQPALTEQKLGKIYVEVLHNISVSRGTGMYTDNEAQRMADAVREFYDRLDDAIHR